MTIKSLTQRGVSHREVARLLGVAEGTVRYHRRRQRERAIDGRSRQAPVATAYQPAIDAYLGALGLEMPANVVSLHEWLVAEHGYAGGVRCLQRYVRSVYPPPPRRARRRVETPPGAQAQVDWAAFPRVWVGGSQCDLLAFHMQLSFSRMPAVVWSERKHELAWLWAHNEAFRRLGGIPATVRVDNEKTAIVHGAGAWGVVNPAYRRYALAVRFHVDACPPRAPQAKGKIERRIRDHRHGVNPYERHWNDLGELQGWSDERIVARAKRRTCPATGSDVYSAWLEEKAALAPVPELPEPFDVAVERRVGEDCTVVFEGRTYSVPFRFCGQRVEVRGCARDVQILAEGGVVAKHPRHTDRRILLDPVHFQGESTATVVAPPPLGRLGARLEAIARLAPQQRPLDLYAALAEVAR